MRKLVLPFATMASLTTWVIAKTDAKTVVSIFHEKQYKKIDVSAVPKDTLDKIRKNYGNYTIKEAYKADDGEYKLVLAKVGVDLIATLLLQERPDKNINFKLEKEASASFFWSSHRGTTP
jgi:two-component SAPR family response regulator